MSKHKVEARDIAVKEDAGMPDPKMAQVWVQGKAAGMSNQALMKSTGLSDRKIRKMNREYADEIAAQIRSNLGEVAVSALQNMVDLAFNAENEHVKFVATKDLLDRAGFAPKKEVDIKTEVIHRDPKEIEREAREKLGDELAERLLGLGSPPEVEDAEFEIGKGESDEG